MTADIFVSTFVIFFVTQNYLGDRHGQPTNGADAVKICGWGGAHNRHGKYQGIDSWYWY